MYTKTSLQRTGLREQWQYCERRESIRIRMEGKKLSWPSYCLWESPPSLWASVIWRAPEPDLPRAPSDYVPVLSPDRALHPRDEVGFVDRGGWRRCWRLHRSWL